MPKEREKKEENLFVEINPHPLVVTDESLGILYFNRSSRFQFPDLEKLGSQHPVLQGLSALGEQLKKQSREMITFVRDVEFEGKVFEEQVVALSEKKRIYLSLVDVTALKRAETELRAANRRLGELLTIKDQLVANVSHELRTPLTAIKEGVSLLKDGVLGSVSEEQSGFLQTVAKNADRLNALIEHLLDLAKIGAGRLPLSRRRLKKLPPLIESNLEQLKSVTGRRRIRCEFGATPEVFADDQKISQVVVNLISNAVKFTQEEGTITFALQGREGVVAVTIQDDGVGIAPGDLPKLFERFSQVGEYKTGGTGLGLVLCKELVELHRGTISVVSEPGKGSAFTFTLPVYTPEFALEESFRQLLETAKSSLAPPMVGLIAIDCETALAATPESRLERLPAPSEARQAGLEQIAERLRHYVKNGDLVLAREPQWVVILACTDTKGVQSICRRLEGSLGPFPAKLGWAFYPMDGEDARTLFAEATSLIRERHAFPQAQRKGKILVADDDSSVLQVMALRFEALGFEVKVASDGEEVLEQVKGQEPIDLILLDLKLPRMDGFEVCRQLKALKSKIPVVAFTAYGKELKDKLGELGLTDVLKKPFGTKELIEKVTQVLERKKATP